jgi:RNA polymerase sigma-70 factor (ECF subfamily)
MDASDDALARLAHAGDPAAIASIVDRYYSDCLRYACRMLGQRADAEEAVQSTFVRAHRTIKRYDDRESFRSWLFRILIERCRARAGPLRRIVRMISPHRAAAPAPWPAPSSSTGDAPRVLAALARLTPAHREAILLRHVEDLSYVEMADLTGLKVSTLIERVKRAREQLQRELETGENA